MSETMAVKFENKLYSIMCEEVIYSIRSEMLCQLNVKYSVKVCNVYIRNEKCANQHSQQLEQHL